MLVTPRLYDLSQIPDKGFRGDTSTSFQGLAGWRYNAADYRHAAEMLLIHQSGAVKVGEVVRYTLTYTPSLDRILPAPTHLHVRVRNTSAIPLRAAYLHGPYTLYAACYPTTFEANHRQEPHSVDSTPEFEPNLKAGGSWAGKLTIPDDIREAAAGPKSRQSLDGHPRSFSWIIEVASQVLFSTTATVHYEVLVGRDDRSVDLGLSTIGGNMHKTVGKLEDHRKLGKKNHTRLTGVFSKAVTLQVEDTDSLWNSPEFPSCDDDGMDKSEDKQERSPREDSVYAPEIPGEQGPAKKRRKRVHLVILTHGLHSNVGADMLYLKESIDACAREACEAARQDRARRRETKRSARNTSAIDDDGSSDDEHEEVIVRGFAGNAVRTERGIQYLGKRLAKYVLALTYPDQPYFPVKSSISKSISRSFSGQRTPDRGKPSHKGSSIHRDDEHGRVDLAYQITSISFIAHSLGGLVQTYAIAYINKHSPGFFELIKPINFVALATPFLGLSNENPIYVKFALDFGLVGRTGQDLGLTWRPPTAMRNGWGAMIGGLGKDSQKAEKTHPDPGTKPLLRILPTGPAHSALKQFRNRTVYSNVVNDGIVPLRTSCLLFLDWKGLERVEKARRDNGLVGTMAGWGWAELTGQNASSPRTKGFWSDIFNDNEDSDSVKTNTGRHDSEDVPLPDAEATTQDNIKNSELAGEIRHDGAQAQGSTKKSPQQTGPWSGLLSMFKPAEAKANRQPRKSSKIYQRGQTMSVQSEQTDLGETTASSAGKSPQRPPKVRGLSLYGEDAPGDGLEAPPKTTFFESAGDVLNPPLPPKEFIIDPSSRPRTIFHDRIYHPQDIPPPLAKKQRSLGPRTLSLESLRQPSGTSNHGVATRPSSNGGPIGSMKVEEKIARAYHHELSWRKVLVRLEPDAHNNIIVRRMFSNAYGWPVIQHLCDTHFAYTEAAMTKDTEESNEERVETKADAIGPEGENVKGQKAPPRAPEERGETTESADKEPRSGTQAYRLETLRPRTQSEAKEMQDEVTDLKTPAPSNSLSSSTRSHSLFRSSSAIWSDRFFEGSDDDSDLDLDENAAVSKRRPGTNDQTQLQPKVANVLSSSPREEKDLHLPGRTPHAKDASGQTTTNPPTKQGPGKVAMGTAGIGIGMKASNKIQSASDSPDDPRLGVSEQVAVAQTKKHE